MQGSHIGATFGATAGGSAHLLLIRLADDAEILARKPGGAPVTALGWSKRGEALAFGTEDGEAGLLAV